MSEIRDEGTISNSKPLMALLLVKPNTSDGVEHLSLIAHLELKGGVLKEPIPKVPLPIKMVLEESSYECDQATVKPLLSLMTKVIL